MKLYGTLIFFLAVSGACGLKCYKCINGDEESCKSIENCPDAITQCFSIKVPGINIATKGCRLPSIPCIDPFLCCKEDLCNGAIPTGPGVFLLLLTSALFILFI